MIIGVDVYHESPETKSVYGFVASLNEFISRWNSVSVFHDKNWRISLNSKVYKWTKKKKNHDEIGKEKN